jgi:FkbM family methyltransferase
MNSLFLQPGRWARWVLGVMTYWTEPSYVERGRRLYPLLFADVVTRAMRRADVGCAFDVGAHRGEFASGIRRAGYEGPIVSFEPNSDAARTLKARAARDGRWSVQEYALGAANADGQLHRPNTTQFASLRETLPYGEERWGDQVTVRDVVKVPVRCLDSVFESVVPAGVDPSTPGSLLLKIDTQGSDLDVLEGATRVLRFVSVLVIELSVIPLYEGAPRLVDALRYVEDAGFVLASVVPVTHDRGSGVPIELDGCFLRRSVVTAARAPESAVPARDDRVGAQPGTPTLHGAPGSGSGRSGARSRGKRVRQGVDLSPLVPQ